MKWTVKNPHGKEEFLIEIPNYIVSNPPAPGQSFELLIHVEGGAPEVRKATILGEGESILLDTHVIRLPRKRVVGKRNTYRYLFGEIPAPRTLKVEPVRPVQAKVTAASLGGGPLKSPMSGKVLQVVVETGATVKEGEVLVIIEAMKMENRILSECAGTVKDLKAVAGTSVSAGDVLLTIVPQETKLGGGPQT